MHIILELPVQQCECYKAVKRLTLPPATFLNSEFPLNTAGMLLRYFVNLYDMEIIEEESFLAWREDIVQEFPGKGKALFQVIWY